MTLSGDAEQGRSQSPDRVGPFALIGALGIVYGDIGTSPLYVFQAIAETNHGHFDELTALGSLSLIFWTLIIVVSLKYALVVMRADNRGEGGILALMSLTRAKWRGRNRYSSPAGLIGAALLYGDGMITPAISVLSAVEGLKLASQDFARCPMPIAAVILMLLFVVQRYGTAAVGRAFGPVMLLWFLTIAILGAIGIAKAPYVIVAVNPLYAASFLMHHGVASLAVLGAVFLLRDRRRGDVRRHGASRPRADPDRLDSNVFRHCFSTMPAKPPWCCKSSDGDANPFFVLVPDGLLYPMIILSTLATVIASQAIITGAFSLTRQAMQLGRLPGMHINQTSSEQYGQIYVPFVNWLMMLGTLALTVIFEAIGSARRRLRRGGVHHHADDHRDPVSHHARVVAVAGVGCDRRVLRLHDSRYGFLCRQSLKMAEGGWIPLVVGGIIFPS